jgi:hypothetical protein
VPEPDIMRWAAKRAAEEAFLLGYDLREYRELHEASQDELASVLGCAPEALVCLSLCRRPDPAAQSFRADVEQIALHCGVNSLKLAALLREVDSIRTIKQSPLPAPTTFAESGLSAAARDRKRKPRKDSPGGKRSGK